MFKVERLRGITGRTKDPKPRSYVFRLSEAVLNSKLAVLTNYDTNYDTRLKHHQKSH